MVANTALSRVAVEREVDRYITWPGQATAYKVGERFDLREFHRTILRCLGPLSAVEECVAAFVTKTPEEITNMDSEGTRVPTPEMTGSSSRIGSSFLPLFLLAMLR